MAIPSIRMNPVSVVVTPEMPPPESRECQAIRFCGSWAACVLCPTAKFRVMSAPSSDGRHGDCLSGTDALDHAVSGAGHGQGVGVRAGARSSGAGCYGHPLSGDLD